jgi:hypothetical protein
MDGTNLNHLPQFAAFGRSERSPTVSPVLATGFRSIHVPERGGV